MALPVNNVDVSDQKADDPSNSAKGVSHLRVLVIGLFFVFGGITSLNDVIIPKLMGLFTLNYTEAMLVQFCFFTSFAVVGLPGAALVKRVGYMRGAVIGVGVMTLGCLLFIPASLSATFGLFLLALFVLASGVVIVQVVSNPLISLLGPAKTAASRLTFAQGFNSLGTVLFPKVGAMLFLGGLASAPVRQLSGAALYAHRVNETRTVVHTYIGLAIVLSLVAGVVWANRNRLQNEAHDDSPILKSFDLLLRPRFSFGALGIFLYVGAEVSIGSLIVAYVQQRSGMSLGAAAAGSYIPYYWGGALIGRFVGSEALKRFNPANVLAFVSCCAIFLIIISANSLGAESYWSLLAIGLTNSIMFPTIFSLASEGLGPRAADGSGILMVAISGGAVIPLLTGAIADLSGSLSMALALPAICYAVIASFGIYARRPVQLVQVTLPA
jgi:MFS transporter, FHS family, L-fucose permease